MKRFIFIFIVAFLISGCENDGGNTPEPQKILTSQDSILSYKGSFIMAGNAAVLKGDKFIFKVKMDSVALILKDSMGNYETKNQSVIPVEIKGKVIDNPEPMGYSHLIEIKEIIKILAERRENNLNEQN
ncbi:hypothetical protein FK178_11675 [Antarcticibacterium arcticum]|uniref:Lipoprotein n=1 Tax=Antarcticibacterium arcticum TaxID=2585771 RepID=A0A5B8YNW7_9FLAO|nr:hypothetical protein [Antarcticibacterium arcticum]QED38333.1 hypothetical protein FK178_11675 [Antarcticibacterium arcticum]